MISGKLEAKLKDITGKIQITVEKEKCPELCDTVDMLTGDSVITVVGTAVENEYVKMNPSSAKSRKVPGGAIRTAR